MPSIDSESNVKRKVYSERRIKSFIKKEREREEVMKKMLV